MKNRFLYVFSDGNVKSNGKINSKGGYSVYFGELLSKFNTTIIDNNRPTNNNWNNGNCENTNRSNDPLSECQDLINNNILVGGCLQLQIYYHTLPRNKFF